MPFTNASTLSPLENGRSSTIGGRHHARRSRTRASSSSARARARRGSRCPISISSSPSSNVGLPAAGTVHEVSAMPIERPFALTSRQMSATSFRGRCSSAAAPGDLLHQHRGADAAAPGRVQGVLHGDVVVDHDRLDVGALGAAELGRHLEVHDVAGVVLDDVHDAGAAVDGLGRRLHLVGRGRGEDLARDTPRRACPCRRTRRASARGPSHRRRPARPCPGPARRRGRCSTGRR